MLRARRSGVGLRSGAGAGYPADRVRGPVCDLCYSRGNARSNGPESRRRPQGSGHAHLQAHEASVAGGSGLGAA